jgi:hypothetical protein
MRYTRAMLAACTLLLILCASSGCATTHPPAPLVGVDIVSIEKGAVAPISGTIFSPFYLERYLQWKEAQ